MCSICSSPPILRQGGATRHEMALLVSLLSLAGKVVAAPDIALPVNSQVPPVARIGKPFSFTFSASTFTSNTAILDYVVTDTPAWLHFDASSRTLSGTPGPDAAGSPKFDLVATDIAGSTTMPVTLVVSTNSGPSLGTPVEDQLSAHRGFQPPDTILLPHSSALGISFAPDTFVNTDHDTVYYAMCANNTPLPSWITFEIGSLSFSGAAPQTTSPDELPQTFNIQFTASDVVGFSAAVASFRVTVENHVLMFGNGYYAVSMTPGLPFDYHGLQGALRLNDHPVDHAMVPHIQVGTPSWLSFDQDTWVLSGIPPLSARSQNISVTAVDTYGEVAVTTILLQVETNSTTDLFDGIPDSINATAGMDFNLTFNANEATTSDAELAVELGIASSWLRFDAVNQQLSGRVPKDLPPQSIVLNVTLSQGPTIRSKPLTISVQDATRSANGRATDTPSPSTGSSPAASSTTSAPSSSLETESRSRQNDSRIAAAIAVPVIAICLLLILACCIFARRRRRRRTQTDWSSERKSKVSRPFLSDETRDKEYAGVFIEKPVPAVEKPSRAPFIDLPGFRTSMANKRNSFFRRSKATADEAVHTPDVDSWDLYTRELSTGQPKEVEQRQFSLVPEERASSARGKRRTSSNKQSFRSSKPLGITNVSPTKRTGRNKRRSDMSFASAGLPGNQRMSGFGHGRNRSSLGTYSSLGRIPRGIGHGNGGPVDWGHVRKSWRDRSRSSCWTTTNASDLSSRNYNSSDRSQNIGSTMQSFPRPPTSGTLEHLPRPTIIPKTGDGRRESIRVVEAEPPLTYSLSLHAFNKRRARNRQNRNTFFAAGPSSRVSSHLKWTHPIQSPMLSPTRSMDSATSILAKRRSSRFERSATKRTSSRSSSISSPTYRKPIKPRPSPRKRGSGTPHDRGGGLATLISNAITQRIRSDSKSSIASSSRRFGSARASGEFSNPSPELGLEEVKDEEGNRRWKYPDVHPNPLGLHTPVDTPPNGGSPEMTEKQRHGGEEYVTARQMLLEPLGRSTEGLMSGRLQRMSHLRQQGIGGRHGAGESGQRRVLVGGSRGKRPVSVDNGLVARGASMRGDLVGGDDEEERDIAFV